MRKLSVTTLLILAVSLPLQAAREKDQSYIAYDDGGTIVRQAEDGRELEARINMPVFPGDEVITNRRGRAEVRLSDGNVVGIDRATSVRFPSMLDNYEGESGETVAELRYGKAMVFRAGEGREALRVDTASASYFAAREAVFSVESDARGRDRVAVFDGAIEVRTPARTTRVRTGEAAGIDNRGIYDLVNDDNISADDFEQWFLRRVERYGRSTSRYLDSSLAYYEDDLNRNGSWIFVSGFGWSWRPRVASGWRPYYQGQWVRGRAGNLTWVSYEPWGWVPYHFGRWSYDPIYGWFWVPGTGYAPAWVYWMYGPGYIGWAPAGWYDCHRPYYDWAYRPYANASIGFGFYGRVRVGDIDLRPWTFVDANTVVSNRVDRAALTTDVIRGRLVRENGGYATVSSDPARFSRNDMKDPAAAVGVISRRGLGGGTGDKGNESSTDMTPFFRRDPELSGNIRDRVARVRPSDGARGATPRPGPSGGASGGASGGLAPIGGGSVAPIGGGNIAPIGGGNVAPIGGGSVTRGGTRPPAATTPRTDRDAESSSGSSWRDRVQRPAVPRKAEPVVRAPEAPAAVAPTPEAEAPRDNWRSRGVRGGDQAAPAPRDSSSGQIQRPRSSEGSSDVSRRVIDGIGGARIRRGDDGGSRGSSAPPPRVERSSPPPSSSSGGSHSGGSSSSGSSSGGSKPSGSSSGSRDSGSASRGEGGKIQRNP